MPPNALFSRVSLGTTDTADAALVVNFVVKTRCNPQVQSPEGKPLHYGSTPPSLPESIYDIRVKVKGIEKNWKPLRAAHKQSGGTQNVLRMACKGKGIKRSYLTAPSEAKILSLLWKAVSND